jgi:hypothetical protein
MARPTWFWILALVITLASAAYQRRTGPTYPLSGTAELGGRTLDYRLDRSHGGETNHPVRIATGDPDVTGSIAWKRLKTADEWTVVPMTSADGVLEAELPHQPPAGKLEYRITLRRREDTVLLPSDGPAVMRFKGDVPLFVLVPHIIAMFGAMLLSTRTGLEFFNPAPKVRPLIFWTIGFLAVGGFLLGPAVQKYAFDAFWTGWPFGQDLTDNKTAVALLGWVVAALALNRARKPAAWALAASILLFAVYLIPHSVLGSELDYTPDNPGAVHSRGQY